MIEETSCATSASGARCGFSMLWSKPGLPCKNTTTGRCRMPGPSGTSPIPATKVETNIAHRDTHRVTVRLLHASEADGRRFGTRRVGMDEHGQRPSVIR
jgi:hypothetical protein